MNAASSRLLAILAPVLLTVPAGADLIIDSASGLMLDIEYSAGTGENTSYLVIDFSATGGTTHAYSFHWNSSPISLTSLDLLSAIVDAGDLDWEYASSEWGPYIENFSFGNEGGDASLFWSYSLGEVDDPGISWVDSQEGIGDRLLADDSIDGWYNGFNEDWSAIPPSVPLVPIPAPPAAIIMLLLHAGYRVPRRRLPVRN